ncbi:hypothetical protein RS24_00791 [Candidatus Micropelagos thuwalensis]|uniref:phosphoglycolate phosphatase n=1 Tax=Candidatus Micropelagius thuwalensis TaxID=1397666 RepID=U2XW62_9PROT|nr:HAD hydrolase-like protein [Candidatus Micropelagos thuwalensis]ERL47071.1 hypothetical protein RS24_00791 [Candidatus Micropelagos thuwalensis]
MPSLFDLISDKKIVVFDFDGVLVDSVGIKAKAYEQMYEEYGSSIVKKVRSHHLQNGGMSRFKKFKYYHETYLGEKLELKDIERMSQKFSELVVTQVISSNWIPGAQDFLQKLYEEKIDCVIVSATPQLEIEQIVIERKMAKYFIDIFGSPTSKYDNLGIILTKHQVTPSELIFFGDALADWQAASKMGVPFVGVGKEIKDLLANHLNCDHFISNFEI